MYTIRHTVMTIQIKNAIL